MASSSSLLESPCVDSALSFSNRNKGHHEAPSRQIRRLPVSVDVSQVNGHRHWAAPAASGESQQDGTGEAEHQSRG